MNPPRPPDRALDRAVWGSAAAGVLATYLVQLSTLGAVKLAAKQAGFVGGKRPGRSELIDLALATLGPLDWFAAVLGGAALLALIVLELRGRRVSRAVAAALSGKAAAWPLLAVIGAMAVRSYLDPGIPHLFDAKQHYAKIAATSQIFADGEWPTWTWRWYGGFPLLRFYAPLLYIVSGAIGALTGPEAGIKIVLVLVHLGSGAVFLRWVQAWSGSRRTAIFATCAYLLVFQRFHSLLAIGRLPEAPLYLFFPWLLLCVERFVKKGSPREGLRAGAVLAAMVLTHPMMGALGGVFGGLYALLRLIATRRLALGPTMKFAVLTGLFGFLLTCFWVVPAITLRPHVLLDQMYGGGIGALVPLSYDLRDVENLVHRGSPARTGASIAYAGWVLLALTAIAAWRHVRRDPARAIPVLGMVVVGLIYCGGGYFLTRAVVFLPAFLCAAAGWAVAGEAERTESPPAWLKPLGIAGLAFLALVGDFLPGTLRSSFRPDLRPLQDSLQRLADRTAGTKAVVASRRGARIDISQWTGWDDSSLMVLGGPFREGATGLFGWGMTALARTQDDLRDGGPLRPGTVDALRLLGVEWIVVEDGAGFVDAGVEPGAGYTLDPDLPGVRIEGAAGVFFARSAVPDDGDLEAAPVLFDLPEKAAVRDPWDTRVDRFVAASGNAEDGTIRTIQLAPDAAPLEGLTVPAEPVTLVRRGHRELDFSVTLDGPALAVLPFAYFPAARAFEDVSGVSFPLPLHRTAAGFLAVELEGGRHAVTVSGPERPPSRSWFFLSVLAWLVWIWETRTSVGRGGQPPRRAESIEPDEATGDLG